MSHANQHIAVLTGDLVNSTGLGPAKVEQAFAALEDCAKQQAAWMGGESLRFTRHRGDGWQVALAEAKYALRSALAFRASLRALGKEFDSYMGLAEGDINPPLQPDLNDETSAVFTHSGRSLEGAKTAQPLRIHFAATTAGSGTKAAAFALADCISSDWSAAQASAILALFEPNTDKTQSEIARNLGKSRQAVKKALTAAKYDQLAFALTQYEKNHA